MDFETRFRFCVSHDVRGDLDTGYFWATSRDEAFLDAVEFCATPYKGHHKALSSTMIDVTGWDMAQVGPEAYLTRDEYLCACPKQLEIFIAKHDNDAKNALARINAGGNGWDQMHFRWAEAAKAALEEKLAECREVANA